MAIQAAQENDAALGHGAAANNGVIGWINISTQLADLETKLNMPDKTGDHPNPRTIYEQSNPLIAKAAMMAADPYIHYDQYDSDADGYVTSDELAIVIIAAGYEVSFVQAANPGVWGHSSSISTEDGGYPLLDGKKLGAYRSGYRTAWRQRRLLSVRRKARNLGRLSPGYHGHHGS